MIAYAASALAAVLGSAALCVVLHVVGNALALFHAAGLARIHNHPQETNA